MKTRIRFGFKSKTQMPLFMVIKESYDDNGECVGVKVLFETNGYYLTHYTEYPIYEPAEGGYYYAGNEAGACYKFLTKWGAKRKLREMEAELEEDGFIVYKDHACLYSKYIGDGESWHVEKQYGSHNSGRQIYQ